MAETMLQMILHHAGQVPSKESNIDEKEEVRSSSGMYIKEEAAIESQKRLDV